MRVSGPCYVTVHSMTFDRKSNARQRSVELKPNRRCNLGDNAPRFQRRTAMTSHSPSHAGSQDIARSIAAVEQRSVRGRIAGDQLVYAYVHVPTRRRSPRHPPRPDPPSSVPPLPHMPAPPTARRSSTTFRRFLPSFRFVR